MLGFNNLVLGLWLWLSLLVCGADGLTYATKSISVVPYANRHAIYTTVAGGPPTLTLVDTGSSFYVIEANYVGPNIHLTQQKITLVYAHGTHPRVGRIGYAVVSLLSSKMQMLLQTTSVIPVIVVPTGTIGSQGNHAIMGLRLGSNVSLNLFLPYPYNQMFITDFRESKLIFGNLSNQQLQKFAQVNLPVVKCELTKVATNLPIKCWDDRALNVAYTISDVAKPMFNHYVNYPTFFDSGASSSLQLSFLPNYLVLNKKRQLINNIRAMLATDHGQYPLYLTRTVRAFVTYPKASRVNLGNSIFNHYQILFDRAHGHIGLD